VRDDRGRAEVVGLRKKAMILASIIVVVGLLVGSLFGGSRGRSSAWLAPARPCSQFAKSLPRIIANSPQVARSGVNPSRSFSMSGGAKNQHPPNPPCRSLGSEFLARCSRREAHIAYRASMLCEIMLTAGRGGHVEWPAFQKTPHTTRAEED
jgi:hypothetical protein